MCGISIILCHEGTANCSEEISERLKNRGPDIQNTVKVELKEGLVAYFTGCVLHLRGNPTPQPMVDSKGNVLLWNAEIFGGLEVCSDDNDGDVLMRQLEQHDDEDHILAVMGQVQGPWAFVYWQATKNKLWFGRDIFGRRSLLLHQDNHGICLSSIKIDGFLQNWQEIPAMGLYCLNLVPNTKIEESGHHFLDNFNKSTLFPFTRLKCTSSMNQTSTENLLSVLKATQIFTHVSEKEVPVPVGHFNDNIPNDDLIENLKMIGASDLEMDSTDTLLSLATPRQHVLADQLIDTLGNAVKLRVTRQPQLCSHCIAKRMNLGKYSGSSNQTMDQYLERLEEVKLDLEGMSPGIQKSQCSSELGCGHSRVAVLFSGGVDSIVLAALADRYVKTEEPIDLLNVAFEQRTKGGGKQKESKDPYDVPDRLTGLSGWQELQHINPHRQWNFIKVNVGKDELQELRGKMIRDLVYPLQTVLDDSIGCAVWFAARGQGSMHTHEGDQPYATTARVVLVGMGADEQFAGYSRHRGRFGSEGWHGLVQEILLEIQRISARNLGRDDRIITDHGRESRFPFLDENVVSFLNSIPIWEKANLNLPRGIGEKMLLRLCAVKLGLSRSAMLAKRAIQFGSRIAKLENSKEKASDVCCRLMDS